MLSCENDVKCVPLDVQLQSFEQRCKELGADLVMSNERHKHSLHELSSKDEEVVSLKVELAAMHDKLRSKMEEVTNIWLTVALLQPLVCILS